MAVLVEDAAYHLRTRPVVVGDGPAAEGGGPVGDGEAGVVAGDQGASQQQEEGRRRGADREGVVRRVVGRGLRFQKKLLM